MRKIGIGFAVVLAAWGMAGEAQAGRAEPAKTHLTGGGFYSVVIGLTSYGGKIASERRKCQEDRKVIVFKQRSGKDDRVISTRSYERKDAPGKYVWSTAMDGQAKGRYYAYAPAIKGCEKTSSKPFEIQSN